MRPCLAPHHKFYPPSARANRVPRPRPNENKPLTLIFVPAGFGKTTMVSEWITQATVKFAWVSLYDGDNYPVPFWANVIAALQTVRKGFGDAAAELLRASPVLLLAWQA